MTLTEDVDLLVQWCSLRRSGSRQQFDATCAAAVVGTDLTPPKVLSFIELMGCVEVDWDSSGRWSAAPPALALIGGSGGNAAVLGARTTGTWQRLVLLAENDVISGPVAVANPDGYPSTWFVAVRSGQGLDAAAKAIGAVPVTDLARLYLTCFSDLPAMLEASASRFVPSSFQPRRLDPEQLRFLDTEVSRDNWPPGCFEQKSRGRNRYLFVDDDGTRHLMDRWMAIHAELNRCRRRGQPVPAVLTWDHRTERMKNLAGARLPTHWARTATMCTGMAPRRFKGRSWVDVYDGVDALLWKRLCEALSIPLQTEDLSDYSEEA